MLQEEPRALVEHVRVRVLIQVLGDHLKRGELLGAEAQLQCPGHVTALPSTNTAATQARGHSKAFNWFAIFIGIVPVRDSGSESRC